MASLVSLLTMRDQVRLRVDLVNSSIVTDAELNGYINASLAKLHGWLVGVDSEHLLKTQSITLTGATSYALASDFFKDKKVDFLSGGQTFDCQRVSIAEKNRYTNWPELQTFFNRVSPALAYYIADAYLYVLPLSYTGGSISLLYYPTAPVLSADGDTFDSLNRFDEYVICDVCAKVCRKLNLAEDYAGWVRERDEVKAMVETLGQDRDMGDSWGMTRTARGGRW